MATCMDEAVEVRHLCYGCETILGYGSVEGNSMIGNAYTYSIDLNEALASEDRYNGHCARINESR